MLTVMYENSKKQADSLGLLNVFLTRSGGLIHFC